MYEESRRRIRGWSSPFGKPWLSASTTTLFWRLSATRQRFRKQTSVRSGLDLQRCSYFSVGYSLCPRRAARARLVGTDWKRRLHVRFKAKHRFVMHWFRLAERKQPKLLYMFILLHFIYLYRYISFTKQIFKGLNEFGEISILITLLVQFYFYTSISLIMEKKLNKFKLYQNSQLYIFLPGFIQCPEVFSGNVCTLVHI